MKYTTFRNTLLAGAALAVVGGFFYTKRSQPVTQTQMEAASTVSPPPSELPPVTDTKPTPRPEPSTASRTADPPATRGATGLPAARGLVALPASGQADKGTKTPLRELDRELLQLYKQTEAGGAKTTKGKDVFPSRPYKVNLYAEGDKVVRAKVDLNRNNKWDEKWSFEPGGEIKRQVSPTDDDTTYTQSYKLAGESWVQK